MSNLRNRDTSKNTPKQTVTGSNSIPLAEKNENIKKPSTSKFKDKYSGLTYNYEDRISKMKVFKTAILMISLTLMVAYIIYELYIWFSNVIFDFYWHHIRMVRSFDDPHFIRSIWIGNFKDLFFIIFKMIVLYFFFKFMNSKLLLTYDDTDELEKYN